MPYLHCLDNEMNPTVSPMRKILEEAFINFLEDHISARTANSFMLRNPQSKPLIWRTLAANTRNPGHSDRSGNKMEV
jgi:hypothetical protein